MALNLKPEPIVIKRTVLKIDGSVLSPFHEKTLVRVFTPQCIASLLNCGCFLGQNGGILQSLLSRKDCLDEKETLKEFGDLNKTIFT
jgi:hypothetical protein